MISKNKKFVFVLMLIAGLFASACDNNNEVEPLTNGDLTLQFDSKFGSQPLNLGTTYTSPEGERVTFSQFRYILSNFVLIREDGSTFEILDSYYFMGQEAADKPNRQTIVLEDLPAGTYIGLNFAIGVDSETNTSTDDFEKGELSASVGMSWNWNTGYKFINWEGTYANTTENRDVLFKLHVGTNDNYRLVQQPFSTPLVVSGNRNARAQFDVRADQALRGIRLNDIGLNFANGTFTGVMVGPADKAAKIANNYAEMVSLRSL